MDERAARAILGIGADGELDIKALNTAFRRALEASPGDQSVYDAYEVLSAGLRGEGGSASFDARARAVHDAVGRAVGKDGHAECEEPAPDGAPGWYRTCRSVLQHLPYRLMFLALGVFFVWQYTMDPVGAFAGIGRLFFCLVAVVNVFVPFVTNPVRCLAIKLLAFVFRMTGTVASRGIG